MSRVVDARRSCSDCELLIVGGGPAGLAAAIEASHLGIDTVLVDERPTLGGQIYRQPGPGFVVLDPERLGRDYLRGSALIDDACQSGASLRTRTAVVSIRGTSAVLLTDGADRAEMLRARRVLLATGAYDRPVAFPGWTLPGVITAGGAQALVKTSRISPGERVAFVGSGPLALAFPAQLRHYGVNVTLVLEAGPPPGLATLARLAAAGHHSESLLLDGARYRYQLLRDRVPLRYRRAVVRVEGTNRVEALVHAAVDEDWRVISGTEERVALDTVCVGYGFVPSVELAQLIGCRCRYDEDLGGPVIELDPSGRTSVAGVFAAGDGTGVRGAPTAIDQGRLAALGVAVDLGRLSRDSAGALEHPIRRRLAARERFRLSLSKMYRVGAGLYDMSTSDTVVCRCEEVTRGTVEQALEATRDINVLKSYTRVGMGLCQGRNCQRHVTALLARRLGRSLEGIAAMTPRPPVRPIPLSCLADDSVRDEGLFVRG